MKLKYIYIWAFISLLSQAAFTQTTFTTTVSKNKLGVNQRFRVTFSINKQGADHFTPPSFKNFRVVAGPSQSVNQSWINGKASFSQSYIYTLQPKQEGTFSVSSATIQLNGKTLKSNSVKINVLKAVDIPKNPNDPYYIAQQNVHLVAEISKKRPYVGEGIYVEYKLYVSHNISIHDFSVTESPQYNNFWNQDIKVNNLPVKNGKYNGEKYRYVVLKKALLIPTKSGKLTIDPMKMEIKIGVPTGRGDFFGNAITRNISKDFASPKRTVFVKELPLENKPANFNGAVGQFNFTIALSKEELKANESAQVKVSVTGKGNLKLFEIPKIETPKELEVYTPEHSEKIRTTLTGLKGSVSDLYTIVPEYRGKYKIPKVSFSYFNPVKGTYHTSTTEALFVNVLVGKEIVATTNNNIKKGIAITGENFRYIQTKSVFAPLKEADFFQSNLFYILLLLPLVTIPIGIFISSKNAERNRDIAGIKQRKADRLARKYLSEAKKQLNNKEHFYIALEKALHHYLKATLQIETADISKDKITELLLQRTIDTQTIASFISVLNDCDFARYTPITTLMMHDEFEKAKHVIIELDKQL
ncbi:MAG: BatD family protein [Polaribacter sp.]|nr:BatD family protein [Polaribacter sp.]